MTLDCAQRIIRTRRKKEKKKDDIQRTITTPLGTVDQSAKTNSYII
jgi:hypothetical protein